MNKEYNIINQIKQDNTILKVQIMNDEMKSRVLKLEMDRLNELVPLINEGMNDAFKEDELLVLVKENNSSSEYITNNSISKPKTDTPCLTLLSESGKIIGEEVYDEEELEELKQRSDVFFMSDNFVTYGGVGITGEKQFFKISSVDSSLFTDMDLSESASSITVAIPSTNTDHYIKEVLGYSPEENLGTVIVGFSE